MKNKSSNLNKSSDSNIGDNFKGKGYYVLPDMTVVIGRHPLEIACNKSRMKRYIRNTLECAALAFIIAAPFIYLYFIN